MNKTRAAYLNVSKAVAYRGWQRLVQLNLLVVAGGGGNEQRNFRLYTLERTDAELDDALGWLAPQAPTAVRQWISQTMIY